MRGNPPLSLTVTFSQITLLLWVTCTVNSGYKPDALYSHTSAITPNLSTVNTYSVTQTLNLHKYTPANKYAKSFRNISSYLLPIVVATSADIELNPGPRQIKYPCGTCGKAVTWKQKGIRCGNSDCGQWYHINCQNMRSTIYEHMDSSKCTWECLKCALPNYSSSLFDLHDVSTQNSFSTLNDSNDDSTDMLSPGLPIASSSPRKKSQVKNAKIKPLRILNVNCQSISNKREEFEQLLDSTKADVIFGTESWLRKDIKDHEVFPDGYTVYRKDRKNSIGGGSSVHSCEGLSDKLSSG